MRSSKPVASLHSIFSLCAVSSSCISHALLRSLQFNERISRIQNRIVNFGKLSKLSLLSFTDSWPLFCFLHLFRFTWLEQERSAGRANALSVCVFVYLLQAFKPVLRSHTSVVCVCVCTCELSMSSQMENCFVTFIYISLYFLVFLYTIHLLLRFRGFPSAKL